MKYRAAVFLLVLGLLAMVSDLLGLELLEGFGAGTGASPAPRVFSAVKGYETYSTRFLLEWHDESGIDHSIELTPQLYARLRGPYNRRNAYGAVVAYGPVLSTDERTQDMFWSVARYAVTGKAPLLQELGVDPATIDGLVRMRFIPRPGSEMGGLPQSITVAAP